MITESQLIEARDGCCELTVAIAAFHRAVGLELAIAKGWGDWDQFWKSVEHNSGVFNKTFWHCQSVFTKEARDFIRKAKHRCKARYGLELEPIQLDWINDDTFFVTTFHELAWMCGQQFNHVFKAHANIPMVDPLGLAEGFYESLSPIAETIVPETQSQILIEHEEAVFLLGEAPGGARANIKTGNGESQRRLSPKQLADLANRINPADAPSAKTISNSIPASDRNGNYESSLGILRKRFPKIAWPETYDEALNQLSNRE